jgi:methionine-gamma-lyase
LYADAPTPGRGTLLLHADDSLRASSAVVPPIHQTATFRGESAEDIRGMACEPRHHGFYTRYGNPTHAHAEAVIARLEGGEAAMLTASGMAAMSTAVLALVSQGDHVIVQKNQYGGTTTLARDLLPRWGIQVTSVDQTSPADFAEAIRPNTRLILLESPSNPLLRLTELAAVAELARPRGIVTLADNTFASPFNQQPLTLGIDLVVHSATKYLAGHSDLMAGAVVGSTALIQDIWKASIVLGASLGPFDSWLLLRGLRTLAVRMERHNRTASVVARFLEAHPKVHRVYFPGLESHPQRALFEKQMTGPSGVLSFEPRGGADAAERLISALRLPARAASVGGVESLVVRPAEMLAASVSAEEFAAVGVTPALIRLSVGLEDEGDLIHDLEVALSRA